MKNNYQIEGDVVKVFFRNADGYFVIDKDDLEKISNFTWHLNQNGYVESVDYKSREHIKAHHIIIGKPPKGLVTDHINRNRLDNRKSNLRHVTPRENCLNRSVCDHKIANRMMGIKTYNGKRGTTYYVYLHDTNNKTTHIGKFKSIEEAMRARDVAYEKIWER